MAKENSKQKGNKPLTDSKISRNGLSAGTVAPYFCLPTIEGKEMTLAEFQGKRVLLVFSDPGCGPCNMLAPHLERLDGRISNTQVLMISRGDLKTNQAKIAEWGITFPVLLQRQWEISREYGMFATPIAYLIDEQGIIVADVAVGVDAILALVDGGKPMTELVQTRLTVLRQEFEKGQAEFEKIEKQRSYLHEMMLRISGAIQVLEELLAETEISIQSVSDPNQLRTSTNMKSKEVTM